ncbi:uncharacterized protein (TIGR00369 family) [Thermolongibacillus altinsuensis]|uniref:Uncharacterized protein (TIGR00369 family) n=1 Tax=Thermolongibacillus altinsuensis TaxID=575256 RepID=A0A4R1QF76_9BACL|nr:hotdog fold thioesterase [Thermolongibacillus altinsuensis]TCL49741.1 uncharacterized protein (TIGR00369 family) [Thermolongibacillus altinsuensis]
MNGKMNEWIKNTLLEALNIEIIHISEGKVIATMPVNEKTRQPFGILHGGASVALAETAASVGAYALIDPQKEIAVGLEINANHLRPVYEGIVTATATIVHRGKTTMVWNIEIVNEKNELICISRCTMAIREKV